MDNDKQSNLQKGIEAGRGKDFKEAISHLQKARDEDPKNPEILHLLGFAYSKVNQIGEAIPCLEKSLLLDPKQPKVATLLANLLESLPPAHKPKVRKVSTSDLLHYAAFVLAGPLLIGVVVFVIDFILNLDYYKSNTGLIGTIILSMPLLILSGVLVYLYIDARISHNRIRERYKKVIDIDEEAKKSSQAVAKLKQAYDQLDADFQLKKGLLNSDYQAKRNIYEDLLKTITILEEDLDFTTYGLYKPHYDFNTSDMYKAKLEEIRIRQKDLLRAKKAVICDAEWRVGESLSEGRKMTNQYLRLMARAFNGECDAAVLKVRWNNVIKMQERIHKAFEAVNKLGATMRMEVTEEYLNLKLEELYLAHEYQEKKHQEREEERQIREARREEEKVQMEIEEAKRLAEEDEHRYEVALQRARNELNAATEGEIDGLNERIKMLEKELADAHERKERAISRAQFTKSGHVYVLSNIGSFGEEVYKLGLTRRLEPMERVKELGDASVPFPFDVHAMIYSDDAPALEAELHRIFNERRVNRVNTRKEYFRVSLDEVENTVKQLRGEIEFAKLPEAKEYHETIALVEGEMQEKSLEEKVEEKFPTSLF